MGIRQEKEFHISINAYPQGLSVKGEDKNTPRMFRRIKTQRVLADIDPQQPKKVLFLHGVPQSIYSNVGGKQIQV